MKLTEIIQQLEEWRDDTIYDISKANEWETNPKDKYNWNVQAESLRRAISELKGIEFLSNNNVRI